MAFRRGVVKASIVLALGAAVGLLACGGGEEGQDDAADATTVSTSDDPGGGEDMAATGDVDRCPLTAEQVGEVLGQEMTADEASCSFFPLDSGMPNAGFNVQITNACSEEVLSPMGYQQAVSGLGDAAYVQRGMADGTWLLVCDGDAPFEIRVDSGSGDDASQAAAEELARLVLASR